MNGIKNILLPVTAMTLIVLAGCAIRPKDGTMILNSNLSYRVTNGTFELKEITTIKIGNKSLLGWRGNELEIYDKSSGIYLINYKSTAMTTLFSLPSGQTIGLQPVLSSNGKRILFGISQKNSFDWYIADSDCYTNQDNISKLLGTLNKYYFWSGKTKYLYTYGSSYCNVYDLSEAIPSQAQKIKFPDLNRVYDINDQTDQLLLSLFQSDRDISPSLCISNMSGSLLEVLESNYLVRYASFISKDTVAYLSSSTFTIVKIDQPRQRQTYNDVRYYALSPDKNYICMIRENSSDTYDVYIGNLQDGLITNLSMVYKGMDQIPDHIYISQDDKRVSFSSYEKNAGSKNNTVPENTITVMTFQ